MVSILRMFKSAGRITSPSASERPATSKRASCKEERSLSTVDGNKSVVRCVAARVSVKVVQLILCAVVWTIVVCRVWRNHLLDQAVSRQEVIDCVWWEVEISHAFRWQSTSVDGGWSHCVRIAW
jgi:hypothetical protein